MSDEAEATTEVITEALPSEWVNSLPAELKDAPFLRPNKDGTIRPIAEVVSALENAAKLQGNMTETHVKIDSPDAPDDVKAATRERLLTLWPDLRTAEEGEDTVPPADLAGYKLPEGADGLDATMVTDIAQFAIDHKWGQKQFADYATKMVEAQSTATENATQWQTDQNAKLTEKLGAAKTEHLGRVAAALEQAGATTEYTDAIKAGNVDADLVMVIDTLVGQMIDLGDEGTQFVQQVKTGARSLTPNEHKDRIWELRDSLKDMQKSDPRYAVATQKIQDHMALALQ